MYYAFLPGRTDEIVMGDLDRLQGRIWSFIASCPRGATTEDVTQILSMKASTVSARIHELLGLGRVVGLANLRKNRKNRFVMTWKAVRPDDSAPKQIVFSVMR